MTEAERNALIQHHEDQGKAYEKALARTGNSNLRGYITYHKQEAATLREAAHRRTL